MLEHEQTLKARVALPLEASGDRDSHILFLKWNASPEMAERKYRIATIELKRDLFQHYRAHMEGMVESFRTNVTRDGTIQTQGPGSWHAGNWTEPVVYLSLNYPLKDPKGLVPPAEIIDGAQWITSKLNQDLASKNKVLNTLQNLTQLAAVVRRDGETNPVIPFAFLDAYQAMSEADQHVFLRRWYSWVRLADTWEPNETPPPSKPLLQFNYAPLPFPIRPGADASVTIEKAGKTFRAAVILDVSPLYVDIDRGLANYLVRIGLPWDGALGSPEHWSNAERETLWSALFGSFDTLLHYYRSNETGPCPASVVFETSGCTLRDGELANSGIPLDAELYSVALELQAKSILPQKDWDQANAHILPPEEAAAKVSATAPRSREAMPTFPVALGYTPFDRDVRAVINQAHKLTLPRQWSRIRRWKDIVSEEIRRLQEELGTKAYQAGPSGEKPLLERRPVPGQREALWPTVLTERGERVLKATVGPKGYMKEDEQTLTHNFHKCVVGANNEILLEMSINWHGLAGPFVKDWRERKKLEIGEEKLRLEEKRMPLFEDLDAQELARLDDLLRRLTLYERGQSIMEVVLGQVGIQRRNPVEIRADVFKTLIWPNGDAPQNWKREVDGILNALRKIDIVVRTEGRKRIGGFLSYIDTEDEDKVPYVPRGHGGHGHGFYVLPVNEWFLGCLAAFEAGTTDLRSGGQALALNYAKDLPKDEKKSVAGQYEQVNAGTPFYSAVAGHTVYQKYLVLWIETQITEKRDGIAGGSKSPRRHQKVKRGDLEARLPRLYDSTFCPLLPEGQQYVAALGHFDSVAPESGFTLCGTTTSPRENAGARPGGLIEKMSRIMPTGRDRTRKDVIADTLSDLRRVVVEEFGGLVVGKISPKDRTDGADEPLWLPLEQFSDLDEKRLLHRLKVLIFLPPAWNDRRKAAWEEATGYRVTENTEEAQAAAWGDDKPEALQPGETWGPENAWRGLSLATRLHAAMKHRKLKQRDLARIFDVTDGAVTRWLASGRGETDPTKTTRIPEDMAALMARWIEGGGEPSQAELTGLASRQRSPARRLKN